MNEEIKSYSREDIRKMLLAENITDETMVERVWIMSQGNFWGAVLHTSKEQS